MSRFTRFIAVDWSGQAVARPKGVAVAACEEGDDAPRLIEPAGGWSREALSNWMADISLTGEAALIGLDLSPAFPFADAGAYFPGWNRSPQDARTLWSLVENLTAEDPHFGASGFLADPQARRHFRQQFDCGDLFPGGRGRFRVVEHHQEAMRLSPYSCFNLVGASQVGKSSLTGMRVLHRLDGRIAIWPFDPLPSEGPVLVEIYTALAAREAGIRKGLSKIRDVDALNAALTALGSRPHGPLTRTDDHATDALLASAWLRAVAHDPARWNPAPLTPDLARTEGWTFGVV